MNDPEIYVIGAAARATASMVRRSGLNVGLFDAYGDDEFGLESSWGQVIGFEDHVPDLSPEAFRAIVGNRPWLYSGPLENAPDWIDASSQDSTLWGNAASVCRAVRDPVALARVVGEAGSSIRFPETREFEDRPRKLRQWLWKPSKTTGGWRTRRALRVDRSRMHDMSEEACPGIWQKFIPGRTFGATVASDGEKSVLIGLCESLRGAPGRPFAYSGSVGPVHDTCVRRAMPALDSLAQRLTISFGLKGLWNFDLVHHRREGHWYLLEVNPRPSASMEMLELVVKQGLFDVHRKIFEQDRTWFDLARERRRALERTRRKMRKIVIYTERKLRESQIFRHNPLVRSFGRDESLWPDFWHFSDWPREGTVIDAGCPVCTMYGLWSSTGNDPEA
ncbi:ATP-grasp domain-containing protein [bacterium]|nr:ATP-grasp domain-containing protein [bacterium]